MKLFNMSYQDYEVFFQTNLSSFEIHDAYIKGCKIIGFTLKDFITIIKYYPSDIGNEAFILNEETLNLLKNHGFSKWDLNLTEPLVVLSGSEEILDIYMFISWLGNNNLEYELVYINDFYPEF